MRTLLLAATISMMSGICYADNVNVGGALIPVMSTVTFVPQIVQAESVLDEGDTKCAHVLITTGPVYSRNAAGTAWGNATFSACRKCTYVKELRDTTVYVPQPSGKVPSEFDVRVSSAAKRPKPATIEAVLEEVKP